MTAAVPPPATLYLVAPRSLRSWLPHFLDEGERDEVLYVGEQPRVDLAPIFRAIDADPNRVCVLLSGHDSLERDSRLAEAIRRLGMRAIGPSPESVRVGTDKEHMKDFFDRHGFASPRWARASCAAALGGPDDDVVVKRRAGTQSAGTRRERLRECSAGPGELCEVYTDGIEYSVTVYRDEERELVFPPIWKGRTTASLVPPWMRLRVCPDPLLAPQREEALRTTARELARAMDLCGHLEVEYVVGADGAVQVLEVNPRVAGTMRLAASATGTRLFSLHRLPAVSADLQAVCCAAEVPYSGPPFSDPAEGVFATSRATACGPTFADARRKLERVLSRARVAAAAAEEPPRAPRFPRRPSSPSRAPVGAAA